MSANPGDVFALVRGDLQVKVDHMLQNVHWDDFTNEEVAVLVAFLRPVYERYNPSDWPKPELRLLDAGAAL